MCHSMRARWRHVAGTTELMLPSAHPSPEPKRQIDRFRRFCTGKVTSGMLGHAHSPNNCPFAWRIWAPSNTCFLGPIQVLNPTGISIASAVFAGLASVTDRPTDRPTDHATRSITVGRIYVHSTAMRPNTIAVLLLTVCGDVTFMFILKSVK